MAAMRSVANSKLKRVGGFYHATLARLDGQPLFARGSLPTIHNSLTYAIWYIYWVSLLDRGTPVPNIYVYQLHQAERYLVPQGEGLYSVNGVGSFGQDDRSENLLQEAPLLFRQKWAWQGQLTYVPAQCLQRLSAQTIRQGVDRAEWLRLCRNLDEKHPFCNHLFHLNTKV